MQQPPAPKSVFFNAAPATVATNISKDPDRETFTTLLAAQLYSFYITISKTAEFSQDIEEESRRKTSKEKLAMQFLYTMQQTVAEFLKLPGNGTTITVSNILNEITDAFVSHFKEHGFTQEGIKNLSEALSVYSLLLPFTPEGRLLKGGIINCCEWLIKDLQNSVEIDVTDKKIVIMYNGVAYKLTDTQCAISLSYPKKPEGILLTLVEANIKDSATGKACKLARIYNKDQYLKRPPLPIDPQTQTPIKATITEGDDRRLISALADLLLPLQIAQEKKETEEGDAQWKQQAPAPAYPAPRPQSPAPRPQPSMPVAQPYDIFSPIFKT